MFASVDSRKKYNKGPRRHPSRRQDAQAPAPQARNSGLGVNRSLVTRRIKNLSTILHISLLRRDIKRAERAFSILLRCERHGVNLRTLWDIGLEILLRSSANSTVKAKEFLARVRLTSSDIGHHPTAASQVSYSSEST